jgi:hypothetical protein
MVLSGPLDLTSDSGQLSFFLRYLCFMVMHESVRPDRRKMKLTLS